MKRIIIANFYPVWPPIGGGQRRIFFLARELSKSFDVEIVAPEREGTYRAIEFSQTLKEFRVPVEKRFRDLEVRLDSQLKMAADLSYALYWRECSMYQEFLAKRLVGAAAAITAHPYSVYAIKDALGRSGTPIIHDSQNVELKQKKAVLADHMEYLKDIRDVEAVAVAETDLTIACSIDDAQTFEREYGIKGQEIKIVENGVDAIGVPNVADQYKMDIRARLGIENRLVAVFGGSFHHPNFRAVDAIIELARNKPDVAFIILGTVCEYAALRGNVPSNVRALGAVDESVKWLVFSIADIGLNPMEEGSGTNIKMFEYAAAGMVVVSSRFGARGVPLVEGTEFIVAESNEMADALQRLALMGAGGRREIGERARVAIRSAADWSVIGRRYISAVAGVAGGI